MEKDIELALAKEEEYIQRKIVSGDNTANLYEYLSQAGYYDFNEFNVDKYYHLLKESNIIPITGSATTLQPMAYENYINGIPFCYFVEYDKNFALVPNSFSSKDEEKFKSYGFDCFKCGYENGGIILTSPSDFRFCLAIRKPNINRLRPYIFDKIYDYLLPYCEGLTIDNNDLMYGGKKVGGNVIFEANGLYVFAINVSIVDMYEYAYEMGIIKDKIPGCLPHIDDIKNKLKNEVISCLSH